MMKRQRMMFLLATTVATSSGAIASPNLVSDGTDYLPEPTHCAFYFDGATTSVREPVGRDQDGLPRCDMDLADIQTGTHTVQASFQIDNGVWGVEEGPLSAPFEFTRPVSAEGIPAPVLRIDLSGGVQVVP